MAGDTRRRSWRLGHASTESTATPKQLLLRSHVSLTRRTLDDFAPSSPILRALDLVPALEGLHYAGVLLDLGVSSHQFDEPARGFSFRRGEPLDMRMTAFSVPLATDGDPAESANHGGGVAQHGR